jgi:hypothetical protein
MSDWLARIAGVRGVREVEVEQVTHIRASMTSDDEQLAVEYLEMARGITGDPSKAQLHASVANAYATLALLDQLRARAEQERRKGPPFASNSSRRPLRQTPAPRTNLRPTPTINSKEKCKKVSSFFLMGRPGDRQVFASASPGCSR